MKLAIELQQYLTWNMGTCLRNLLTCGMRDVFPYSWSPYPSSTTCSSFSSAPSFSHSEIGSSLTAAIAASKLYLPHWAQVLVMRLNKVFFYEGKGKHLKYKNVLLILCTVKNWLSILRSMILFWRIYFVIIYIGLKIAGIFFFFRWKYHVCYHF